MKKGRFVLILVLIISVLMLGSCSRMTQNAGDDHGDLPEETEELSKTPDSEPTPSPEATSTPDSTEPTSPNPPDSTPDPNNPTNDSIKPIKMSEAGMEPMPLSDLNGADLHPRILALVNEPWSWNADEDYALGIEQYNDGFIIHGRFKESIAGKSTVGSSFSDIQDELGSPGFQQEDLLAYRTTDYYLVFYGQGKLEMAAFMNAPKKDYDDDFLYHLLVELNAEDFTSLEASLEKIDPDLDFFYEKGSDDGTSYYAHSLYGINVSDVEEPIIDIMNNFEGNLYIQTGEIRFSQGFNNLDAIVLKLRDYLYRFDEINQLLDQQGAASPDGRLKAIYHPLHYFVVRTLDASIQDRMIFQKAIGDFYWLGSRYLLYLDDFSQSPEIVDIDDSMLWGESLLEKAGLDSSGSYKILKVDKKVIELEETSKGKTLKIGYAFNSSGEISLTVK